MPHAAGTNAAHVAEPVALLHVQSHVEPPPVTLEALLPGAQRPLLGATADVVPLLAPHDGAVSPAVHATVLEPFVQFQFHGPLPVTLEAEPSVQSPVVGATLNGPVAPHTAGLLAAQLAAPLPLAHVHCHALVVLATLPERVEPAAQRLLLGVVAKTPLFAVPHATGAIAALHAAVVAPCAQLQLHGPLPVISEAAPIPQRFVGVEVSVLPLSVPQVAGVIAALQAAVCEPFVQFQFHGPVPVTLEAEPTPHRLEVGAVPTV